MASKTETKKIEWYIVKSYAGQETTVANNIKQRIKANNLEEEVLEVVVPTQEKIMVKAGKKKTIHEKIFPGYILINMAMSDDTWHVIRNTQGVTGFVGIEKRPTPLSPREVKGIMEFMQIKQPSFQASFGVGDGVKVLDGPFKEFMGSISEINESKGQVKVLLSIFGRETPIVLDFLQVTKI